MPHRDLSPSRISHASWMPVEAPEGTIARTVMPPAVVRSTSTVGLPRESRTSRPTMELILVKVSGYSFLMRARTLAFTMAVGREGCRDKMRSTPSPMQLQLYSRRTRHHFLFSLRREPKYH